MMYRVVPAPKVVKADSGEGATQLFQDILNQQAAQGWTFVSMETITTMSKGGCMKQPVSTSYNMMIFFRP